LIQCREARLRITLFLDQELPPAQALELEAHLNRCAQCAQVYEDLRSVVDAVRLATPLYEVPNQSYAAIERLIGATRDKIPRRRHWLPLAAAAALIVGVILGSWLSRRPGAQYASFAAEAHLLYARGAFPLDVVSRKPQVVSEWLGKRLPFEMKLPNYPAEDLEPKRYSLVGGRLVQYLDEDVAYLAYEMDHKPISLLIASSARIVPSGGDKYKSGGLTFHSSSQKGLRMITWTDKGLTYALVSTLDVPGAESCVICHGSTNDRSKFENLRPSQR
jgi:anti-sigma factor RsiW